MAEPVDLSDTARMLRPYVQTGPRPAFTPRASSSRFWTPDDQSRGSQGIRPDGMDPDLVAALRSDQVAMRVPPPTPQRRLRLVLTEEQRRAALLLENQDEPVA